MRTRPTAYGYGEVRRLVQRLVDTGPITDEKVEFLARRVHQLTGWAGRPIHWDDWTNAGREEGRAHARAALEEAGESA